MKRFILCFALTLSCMAPSAMAGQVADFSAPVPGLPGRTWLDLVKQVVSDAKEAEPPLYGFVGHRGIELRGLQDGAASGDWAETATVIGLDAEAVEVGGRKRIVLALELQDADVSPLVLFEGEGEGRLLDAVDVRTDMHTSYNDPMVQSLGVDGALVTSRGWHSNSNQSYAINTLILIGREKIALIGQVFVYSDNDCRSQVLEKESITLHPAKPLAEIRVSIAHETARLRRDCSTVIGRPQVKIARGAFTWDPAKNEYVARTKALDKLAEENAKRF